MSNIVSATNRIHYNTTRILKNLDTIPSEYLQRALLALAVICAVLSLIPTLGTIGSLSTRSVAVVAASMQCIEVWKQEGTKGLILQIVRLACVVLGLAGVAAHINVLVIAALGGDLILQTLESANGLHKKDLYKSLSHFTMILIDGFTIAGMLTNTWPYLATAGAISALMMFVFAGKAIEKAVSTQDLTHVFDVLSYAALGCVGIASSVRCAELTSTRYTRVYYYYNNTSSVSVSVYDSHGNLLRIIPPHSDAYFSAVAYDTSMLDGNQNYAKIVPSGREECGLRPYSADYHLEVIQKPMTAQEFPTLPIGGPSIVTEDPQWKKEAQINPQQQELENYLEEINKLPIPPALSCLRLQANRAEITFVHEKTDKKSAFDFRTVCEQASYFSTQEDIETETQTAITKEFTLDMEERTYDLLMAYFSRGDLEELEELKEVELIDLYAAANFLAINRLENLCIQLIAKRLKNATWKETELFEPFQKSEVELSKLVNHFTF